MSLTVRKIVVLGLIGAIFLMANILIVANWIAESGIAEKAGWVRREFLTGTAVAVILVLLLTHHVHILDIVGDSYRLKSSLNRGKGKKK